MLLAILTLITALSISAVAIYYSVAGLVAIFAAAAIPIIIMGGVLEIGKLVTAVWLHKYWNRANWWLKTYLSLAVIILMFITSMGIFGFLSKAHIEQTSAAGEGVAQIEQIEAEIARQQAIIARAEQIVETTQTSGTGADQNIQTQIDREQDRIDTAYDRVQPAIDATRAQLERDKQFYLDQLPAIDEKLEQFETLSRIDTSNTEAVKRLQAFVGARPDGAYGGGTARAVKAFKESLEAQRADLLAKVEELKAKAAEEIARLRSRAESEIDDSNTLITRLRSQLGTSTGEDIDAIIDEQNARINTANTELDTLTEEKFQLEAQYRALEAEVGPIKYIAEFVYGEQADKNLLEEAVRWVIIIIIFVFDPLAVLLLIASQYTFQYNREGKNVNENYTNEAPVGGPNVEEGGVVPNHMVETEHEDFKQNVDLIEEGNNETTKAKEDESDSDDGPEDPDRDGPTNRTDTGSKEPVSEEQRTDIEATEEKLETYSDLEGEHFDKLSQQQKQEIAEQYIENLDLEKKDISSEKEEFTEQSNQRKKIIEEQEDDPKWNEAKYQWKNKNPNQTLKFFKNLYIEGKIDKLPWEDYVNENDYIVKEGTVQKTMHKEHSFEKPQYTTVSYPEGYIQNEEQSESSLWKKINKSK